MSSGEKLASQRLLEVLESGVSSNEDVASFVEPFRRNSAVMSAVYSSYSALVALTRRFTQARLPPSCAKML